MSVHPCITDPNIPTKLSGPYLENIVLRYASEALDDIGLINPRGNISIGIFIKLNIGLKNGEEYDRIVLAKQDGDLYVVESESRYSQELLSYVGKDLSDFYDKLLKFYDIKKQHAYGKNTINTSFKVELCSYGVTIYTGPTKGFGSHRSDFSISSHSYTDEYKYKCNSTLILNTTQGNEEEIFKSIFIRIDDCPECIKAKFYQIRQAQLKRNNKKVEEVLEGQNNNIDVESEKNNQESEKKLTLKSVFSSWLTRMTRGI